VTLKELGLFPKGCNESRTTAHATQRFASVISKFSKSLWTEIRKFMMLHITPNVFHRVQFRSVGRKKFQLQAFLLRRYKILHEPAAMTSEPIPNDQEFSGDMSQQMAKKHHHLLAANRSRIQPKEDAPPSNPRNSRQGFPIEVILQNRCLPSRCPCPASMGPLAQPALVYEDDRLSFRFGFFLSAGQRCFFHRRMASSSRSNARPTGRWQLHPIFRRIRQTWSSWYRIPNNSLMRMATRPDVHSEVSYPNISGPRWSSLRSRLKCFSFSFGGLPARPAFFNPVFPCSFNTAAHRFTDCRWTPTCRDTSASFTPFRSRSAAIMRRCSSASKSLFIPAWFPMPVHISQSVKDVTILCRTQ